MRGRRLLAVVAVLLGACARADSDQPRGTVTVLAAASLAEAFTELGTAFEADEHGRGVRFSFASSSTLARQVEQGAAADVIASADETALAALAAAGHATGPVVFARNRLALLVERGNPLRVTGLADLARPGLRVALCAPSAPCGRYAARALDRAGVVLAGASREADVKAVAAKVLLGEADAGVVYATDVRAAGARASGVELDLPDEPGLVAVYAMALTRQVGDPTGGRAWIAFVRSALGRRVLARHGFLPP